MFLEERAGQRKRQSGWPLPFSSQKRKPTKAAAFG